MSVDVAFDEQIFVLQTHGGISRYFVEVMRRLSADPGLGVRAVATPFRKVRNEHLLAAFPGRFELAPEGPGRLRRLLPRPKGLPVSRDTVLHYTYYDESYLRAGHRRPTVSTVHDMIPELYPSGVGNVHLAKRTFVERSTAVICVSESTRRDLVDLYGPVDAQLSVIHLGVGDEFRDPAPARVALPDRYVLFVGHRGHYKDFDVLLRALGRAHGLDDVHLVCVGGNPLSDEEHALAAEQGLDGRLVHLNVSDADLPGVYARALCLAYPSQYEGFGLPVLEAMAAGCPVVASDIPVFRETSDEAPAYFPVGDVEALADQLGRVTTDQARTALIRAGRSRAADFTWERTAAAHAEVYQRAREAGA